MASSRKGSHRVESRFKACQPRSDPDAALREFEQLCAEFARAVDAKVKAMQARDRKAERAYGGFVLTH